MPISGELIAGAMAGLAFVGCSLGGATPAPGPGRRREVVVNGKRVKTVDIHAHCIVPEAATVISHPLDIGDAWKNSYSCSTNHKVWAAKFTARHPNLVALEISSFKCGHDAPIYGVVEGIIEESGTPYFCFKDLDENKPTGSIRIRVETIDYFLRRYREEVIRKRKATEEIEAQLAALEAELRGETASETPRLLQLEQEPQTMAAD